MQPRGPGWGYGLGGSDVKAPTVSNPSFESLSPPQPLTPYAGTAHNGGYLAPAALRVSCHIQVMCISLLLVCVRQPCLRVNVPG